MKATCWNITWTCSATKAAEVLDLAFLNSFYHSGVRNPIDNAILACQTMPGRETHYTDLLTQYQK